MTQTAKRRPASVRVKRNIPYLLLILPASIYLFIFNYLPMFGVVLAFKKFTYKKGILGSPWSGLDNFNYFFTSQDAFRVTFNTVMYNLVFIVLGMVVAVIVALLLYEVRSRALLKYFQTTMILPHFLSWVIVAYMVLLLLNPQYGIVNQLIRSTGGKNIAWYSEAKYWPFILTFANIWKGVGMSSILYYAALMGIDESLFEAAELDGASRLQQVVHISIPSLIPIMCILLIMSTGNVMRGDFGLFYQLPMDVGILYPTTDVIDTYIYRFMISGNMGISSSVGLFQSLVGLVLVVAANAVVRKVSYDNRMF